MSFTDVVASILGQRPGFKDAAGVASVKPSDDVPPPLATIYAAADGTEQETEFQTDVDIVPGFRLIHRKELANETALFHQTYSGIEDFIPFLADDSSCYVAFNGGDGSVVRVAQEYGLSRVADTLDDFWTTVLACYEEGAYFLDEEGFLDYDFEKEGDIGLRINPNCSYWSE